MKKVLSLAIAAALVAPVAAMADATLYGKAHFAVVNTDIDDGNPATDDQDVWSTDSVFSRFGIKGSEDLGGGLTAVYQFEFQVNPDAGSTLNNRNQFIGLAGGFGTFLAGRHDTPMKMSQGKFDVFPDQNYTGVKGGDIAGLIPGDDRVGNVLAYVSPSMGGLTFVGAAVAGEQPGLDLTGIADHYSIAGMYSNGPIYAALAYNGYDLGTAVDASPKEIRGTFVWMGNGWQAGVMYNSFDPDITGLDNSDAIGVSGSFNFTPNDKIKAQYVMADAPVLRIGDLIAGFNPNITLSATVPSVDTDTDQMTVGYEHSFSKRTSAYASYSAYEEDFTGGMSSDVMMFGLVHNF
ncbi:MAG: porin [Candidatus Thiodiazotropha sp.]